jgi:recombination protein RecR
MISDADLCPVCSSHSRERSLVCVVESIRDVISIDNTGQYNGLFHVLGGIISPMDGTGPSDLSIDHLISRVSQGTVKEVFLALSTTMEGETTAYYIFKKLAQFDIKISTIARGVGFGDDLEYTDEVTLGRSIQNRQPFVPLNK